MDETRRNLKVLAVDDEVFVLGLLAQQLANLGLCNVHSHQHAEQALAELERDPAAMDLVFCDLQMPGMDGVEFVRHLSRIGYPGGLVLVSGEDPRILQTAQRLAQAQHLSVLGTLKKPITRLQLRQVLDHPSVGRAPTQSQTGVFDRDELERAIRNREFVNHYQPKVSIATGEPVGVEALVRWRHPSQGLVYPDRFITVAEDYGLIESLTDVVLAEALTHARDWLNAGIDLHIAVNVAMQSLEDLAFVDRVTSATEASGVPMKQLVLEVTESQLMRDPVASVDVLTRLRLRQTGVSIDDFGTGHSSLAKLRDIPFNELKIDRGFVHGAAHDAALRSIVEASLGMASQLGIRTVAEGVEDRDDWDFLRNAGCDYVQGYFITRPMPAEQLASWLDAWPARRATLFEDGA